MADLTRGKFKKRVSFLNATKGNVDGNGTEVYSVFLTTWAMVEDRGGSRTFENAIDSIVDRKDIYVYWRSSLDAALKVDTYIIYNGKEYSIDYYNLVDEIKSIIKFEVSTKK